MEPLCLETVNSIKSGLSAAVQPSHVNWIARPCLLRLGLSAPADKTTSGVTIDPTILVLNAPVAKGLTLTGYVILQSPSSSSKQRRHEEMLGPSIGNTWQIFLSQSKEIICFYLLTNKMMRAPILPFSNLDRMIAYFDEPLFRKILHAG